MWRKRLFLLPIFIFLFTQNAFLQDFKIISQEELRDKLSGYWLGQLVGNYVGFPFENLYVDEPIPLLVDRYLNYKDADELGLKMNLSDRRGYVNILADAMGGAWSDDDTDIELVTLHAVEKYGLNITYEEMASMWKLHINRFIWAGAREARNLMDEGYIPPATGEKKLNEYWYRITSQLMTEIWGAFYPGMTDRAAEGAEWGARIMTDDWATHPDIVYAVMYSAAFFEKDLKDLIPLASAHLPANSPYKQGIHDVLQWHNEGLDWRETRKLMHDKYFYRIEEFEVPYPVGGSIINGLSAIAALLYGDGDFTKTIAIATSMGYDCDNQAATVGGLLGIIIGGSNIPDRFTKELPSRSKWDEPFNNTYINYSRDNLPNYNKISDIIDRLLVVAEHAILENGGRKEEKDGKILYYVRSDIN